MRSDLVLFPARALDDPELTRAHLKVLYHVGRFADFKTGWCYPSLQDLAEKAGLNRRTVVKIMVTLVRLGYVRKERQERADGGYGNNRYLVSLDPPPSGRQAPTPSALPQREAGTTPSALPSEVGVHHNTHINTHTSTTRPNRTNGTDPIGYGRECVIAANVGFRQNPAIGERCNEMILSSQDAHHAWIADGIPVDLAVEAIGERARTMTLKGRQKPPTSLAYFDGKVRDAHERAQLIKFAGELLPSDQAPMSEAEQLAATLRKEASNGAS